MIRAAGVNSCKIYNVLYEYEKNEGRIRLLAKWTHAQFLKELINDAQAQEVKEAC